MPITQERMLTCINAGLSAFNALELARQILSEQIIHIKNRIPNSDTTSILETLQILLMPETLVNTAGPMSYIEAWHQLQMEARHFREFKGRNARAKRQQANKRHSTQKSYPITQIENEAEQTKSLYEQAQEQTKQQTRDKLNKMKSHQTPTIEIDYRNYRPEDFE